VKSQFSKVVLFLAISAQFFAGCKKQEQSQVASSDGGPTNQFKHDSTYQLSLFTCGFDGTECQIIKNNEDVYYILARESVYEIPLSKFKDVRWMFLDVALKHYKDGEDGDVNDNAHLSYYQNFNGLKDVIMPSELDPLPTIWAPNTPSMTLDPITDPAKIQEAGNLYSKLITNLKAGIQNKAEPLLPQDPIVLPKSGLLPNPLMVDTYVSKKQCAYICQKIPGWIFTSRSWLLTDAGGCQECYPPPSDGCSPSAGTQTQYGTCSNANF